MSKPYLGKTAEEYEAAFHGIQLPQGRIELATGVIVLDVPLFLEKSLVLLKHNGPERVKEPVRWRLDTLLKMIESEE